MLTLVPVSPFQVQDSKIAFLYHRPYREYLDVGHPKIHHEHSKHLRFVLDVHQKSFDQSEQRLEYYLPECSGVHQQIQIVQNP